jgi:hypothetical protein
MKLKRKCTYFEIDGTLLEDFIIQSFHRYLANKDFI